MSDTAPDLRALLTAAGIAHTNDAEYLAHLTAPAAVAAQLASYDGPNEYQARASLPGGRIIYTGVHGARRDWARADLAALFSTKPDHWTVTRIRHPSNRPQP